MEGKDVRGMNGTLALRALPVFLLLVILLFSFLLRMEALGEGHYHNISDAHRDYLVASRIVQEGELPLVGPDGQLGPFSNSPLYYYVLAGFLFLEDDFMVLQYVNVLLGVLTVLLLYFLAKSVFGEGAGLLAALFFGLSWTVTSVHSWSMWQPYAMQPLVTASYLLLALFYVKKRYVLLFLSLVVLALSLAMHQSVLGILPAFFAVAGFLLIRQKASLRHYAGALFTFAASLLLFYSPLLLYLIQHSSQLMTFQLPLEVGFSNLSAMLQNIPARMGNFLGPLALASREPLLFSSALLGAAFLGSLALSSCFSRLSRAQKLALGVILFSLVQFAFVVSFFPSLPSQERFFIPVVGLLFVLGAAVLNPATARGAPTFLFKAVAVGMVLGAVSPGLPSQLAQSAQRLHKNAGSALLVSPYAPSADVKVIKQEVLAIAEGEGYEDMRFFRFQSYFGDQEADAYEEMFLVPVETELNTRLVELDDASHRSYRYIAESSPYVFLHCLGSLHAQDNNWKCWKRFAQEYPDYSLLKTLNTEEPLYLAKKNEE